MTKGTDGKVKTKKATISIDLTTKILGLDGEPYDQGMFGKPAVTMTLGSVLIEMLSMPDREAKGDERLRRGRLAQIIYEGGTVAENVNRDDVEKIVSVVKDKMPIPVVAMRVVDLLKEKLEE